MLLDPPAHRTPKTAIHAMVAVLLALVVSAAAPLSGASGEGSLTGIRFVQMADGGAPVACHVDLLVRSEATSSALPPAHSASTQLVRAAERALWRTALPPPAAA